MVRLAYSSASALRRANKVAFVQPVQTPDAGSLGLRSRRQHTVAPFGTSITSGWFLGMTNSRLERYPSPRLSQSEFRVTTSCTLTRSQYGLCRLNRAESAGGAD